VFTPARAARFVLKSSRLLARQDRPISSELSGDGGRGQVLIVEDDVELRTIYHEILRNEGWDVVSAADGIQALEVLERGDVPCVMLLDLRMPRMDGWELAERLRQREEWSRVPLVVVAAHYRVEEEARQLGALGWLQKPVEVDRLLEVVDRVCRSPEVA
jgi:CheY-like chemotaxis protein